LGGKHQPPAGCPLTTQPAGTQRSRTLCARGGVVMMTTPSALRFTLQLAGAGFFDYLHR